MAASISSDSWRPFLSLILLELLEANSVGGIVCWALRERRDAFEASAARGKTVEDRFGSEAAFDREVKRFVQQRVLVPHSKIVWIVRYRNCVARVAIDLVGLR